MSHIILPFEIVQASKKGVFYPIRWKTNRDVCFAAQLVFQVL